MRLVAGCRGQDHKYYLYLLSAKSRSPLITTTCSMMLTDFAILGTSQFYWSQSGLLYAVINGLLLRLEHSRNYETFVIGCFRGVSAHGLEAAPTRRVLPIPRGHNKIIIPLLCGYSHVQSWRFQSAARGIPRKNFPAYSLF